MSIAPPPGWDTRQNAKTMDEIMGGDVPKVDDDDGPKLFVPDPDVAVNVEPLSAPFPSRDRHIDFQPHEPIQARPAPPEPTPPKPTPPKPILSDPSPFSSVRSNSSPFETSPSTYGSASHSSPFGASRHSPPERKLPSFSSVSSSSLSSGPSATELVQNISNEAASNIALGYVETQLSSDCTELKNTLNELLAKVEETRTKLREKEMMLLLLRRTRAEHKRMMQICPSPQTAHERVKGLHNAIKPA